MSVVSRNPEKKQLVLKRGPNGKLQLPISELGKISIRMPAGLPAGYKVVFMQDAASNTTVGVTKDDVDVTPIEDVSRLYEIPRLVRKCEDDVGRAAKTLTAQRLLFDNLEEKTREAPTPSPEFEVAAVDCFTATETLSENVNILTRFESKVPEELLARDFLLEESARIAVVAKKWLQSQARGEPCPKTLVSALKESAVSNWVYSRLLKPLPENQRNWFRFLFPKDPAKGIRMNLVEFTKLSELKAGPMLLVGSRVLFDLVDRLGEEKSEKSDKEASYLLLPQFTALEELAQVRVKFPNITCISKKLQVSLNALYSMSRAILPLDEKARDALIELLFEKPEYERDHILTPMQQIVQKHDQRFRFWDLKSEQVLKALEFYNCPKQLLDKFTKEDLSDLTYHPLEAVEKVAGNISSHVIRPQVAPEDTAFKKFVKLLEDKGLLQRKKRDRNRVPLYTFVPTGPTKALLELVKVHKPFAPITEDVERYLIQFKNSRLRDSAAVQLHAALLGLQVAKKIRINVTGIDVLPPTEGDATSFVTNDEDEDDIPVDYD